MASDWHPCAMNRVRFDVPADNAQAAFEMLPKKYKDLIPEDLTPDEAGWVYLDPSNDLETKSIFAPGQDARMAALVGWAIVVGAQMSVDGEVGDPGQQLEDLASTALREKAEFIAENMQKAPKKKTPVKVETKPVEDDESEPEAGMMITALVKGKKHRGVLQPDGQFSYKVGRGYSVVPQGEFSQVVEA